MHPTLDFALHALLIGVGATAILDLWALLQHAAWGVPKANWALVGRWVGYFPRGQFIHKSIAQAAPVPGEHLIGWTAHYLVGIVFAGVLLALFGLQWAEHPTLLPALIVGVLSVAAPYFILQPGMGAGIAASKTPKPNLARMRSLISHSVFGLGLYGAGLFWAVLRALG